MARLPGIGAGLLIAASLGVAIGFLSSGPRAAAEASSEIELPSDGVTAPEADVERADKRSTRVALAEPSDPADAEWLAAASGRAPAPIAQSASGGVFFRRCSEAWAAGVAPMRLGEPGYRPGLDGDGDGIACEPYHPR